MHWTPMRKLMCLGKLLHMGSGIKNDFRDIKKFEIILAQMIAAPWKKRVVTSKSVSWLDKGLLS